jgi:TRAP-type mannitol/chloroaromatic compound transport system permease large subunit
MKDDTAAFPSFKIASSIVLIFLCIGTLILGVFPLDTWSRALEAAGAVLVAFRGG